MDGTFAAEQVLFPPGAQRVEFLENHDTNRAMSQVEGDPRRAKLGALLLLTLPGTPMIYYGEEIGMSGVKPSPPQDDKTLREPMDWYASAFGPGMTNWYTPVDSNNKPNDGISVEEEQGKPDSLLEYYRALVALRNANPALRTGAMEKIDLPADSNAYAYLRQDSTTSFVIVLNFEDKPVALTLDLGVTSLPAGPYAATDAFSKRTFDLDGLTLKLNLDAASGYVLRLSRR
jgi:glycosidase